MYDHSSVRDGIAFALQMRREMGLVGQAANAQEALALRIMLKGI